ncbi:MAG: hypothetical protein ACTSPW_15325 [Promethearchaeota archaeon]
MFLPRIKFENLNQEQLYDIAINHIINKERIKAIKYIKKFELLEYLIITSKFPFNYIALINLFKYHLDKDIKKIIEYLTENCPLEKDEQLNLIYNISEIDYFFYIIKYDLIPPYILENFIKQGIKEDSFIKHIKNLQDIEVREKIINSISRISLIYKLIKLNVLKKTEIDNFCIKLINYINYNSKKINFNNLFEDIFYYELVKYKSGKLHKLFLKKIEPSIKESIKNFFKGSFSKNLELVYTFIENKKKCSDLDPLELKFYQYYKNLRDKYNNIRVYYSTGKFKNELISYVDGKRIKYNSTKIKILISLNDDKFHLISELQINNLKKATILNHIRDLIKLNLIIKQNKKFQITEKGKYLLFLFEKDL